MKAEGVLYTDGHDVTVTYSGIHVKKRWYALSGITKHGVSMLSPLRFPFVIMLIVGVMLSVLSATNLVPEPAKDWRIELLGVEHYAREVIFYFGSLMILLACLLMYFVPERYAVTITTAEGDKHLVVSKRREYINQIINALNEALLTRIKSGARRARTRYQDFLVSAR